MNRYDSEKEIEAEERAAETRSLSSDALSCDRNCAIILGPRHKEVGEGAQEETRREGKKKRRNRQEIGTSVHR